MMFDLGLFFIFTNIFILMLVFWVLSWLGEKLYKVKYYNSSTEVYECGFYTYHSLKMELNLSFVMIAFLLILYDMEFFFLMPFFFNLVGSTFLSSVIFWTFLMFILMSFLIDWESMVLDWVS